MVAKNALLGYNYSKMHPSFTLFGASEQSCSYTVSCGDMAIQKKKICKYR